MYNLHRVLQYVVYGFDNISLAQHHSVIERHQLVFHVYAQPCYQLYTIYDISYHCGFVLKINFLHLQFY